MNEKLRTSIFATVVLTLAVLRAEADMGLVPAGIDVLSATSIVIDVTTTNLKTRIQRVREEIVGRVGEDDGAKSKIEGLLDRSIVEVDGTRMERAQVARMDLLTMGERALPVLIDSSVHPNPEMRARVMPLIYRISCRKMAGLDMFPVYLRALSDSDEAVRNAAICQVGSISIVLAMAKKDAECDILARVLAQRLDDKSDTVQALAGSYLFRCERRNMVPEALVKKYNLGPLQF